MLTQYTRFVATFADDFGHRPAFLVCNTIYIISNVALATQNSYAALLVLRMLQSCGSSGTISLRNGIIAAIFTPAERGTYMGIIAGVTLCAPAFGPLIGGALTQTLGWRSIFWGLTIFTTAQTLIYALFVPETNRRVVGNGSIKPEQWWNQTAWQLIRESSSQQTVSPIATKTKVKLRWPNPIKVLAMLKEPDIALLIVTGSLCNAATYDIMASLPYMMTHTYGLSIIQLSLCYMYVNHAFLSRISIPPCYPSFPSKHKPN
jgi:MFS family permease